MRPGLTDDVDSAVRAAIEARLDALEAEHDVRILYACESGSRGWGFASPDSDYDVRFIYVHPLSWYLRVEPQRDVLEVPIDGTLDLSGWELRKALGLLKKGNATLVEWLDSPIIYRADEPFLLALRDAARETYRPERALHHYRQLARNSRRELPTPGPVSLKKCLYALRALLAMTWIERGLGPVPMRFQRLVDAVVDEVNVRRALADLVAVKRAGEEGQRSAVDPALARFMEHGFERMEKVSSMPPPWLDFSVLDRLLIDTIVGNDGRARS